MHWRRVVSLWGLLLLLACNIDRNADGVFRVACLGDSNTAAGWPTPEIGRWCERMPGLLPTVAASSGGTYTILPTAWENHAMGGGTTFALPAPFAGLPNQIDAMSSLVDIAVAAFGTNDAATWTGLTPQDAINNLLAAEAALKPRGIALWVATAPPNPGDPTRQPWLDEFNALVRATWCRVIDFDSGMPPTLFDADGIHLNAAGQDLRAQRVANALNNRNCL